MTIRTLIVDDERLARDRVRRFLRDEPAVEIVGEARDGGEALGMIRSLAPDLVVLDIQMPEKNGFEVIRELGESGRPPAIIFVTAYDQYALQAFEIHALDYVLKPISRERFRGALNHAREQIERRSTGRLDEHLISLISDLRAGGRKYLERLVVKSVGRVFFLRTEEIDWIEAAGNYVKLHAGRESHMVRETMHGIEAKLDPNKFLRIHRSTMVNIDRIKELRPMFSGDYEVILRGGTELTLSRNYRERFLELFGEEA